MFLHVLDFQVQLVQLVQLTTKLQARRCPSMMRWIKDWSAFTFLATWTPPGAPGANCIYGCDGCEHTSLTKMDQTYTVYLTCIFHYFFNNLIRTTHVKFMALRFKVLGRADQRWPLLVLQPPTNLSESLTISVTILGKAGKQIETESSQIHLSSSVIIYHHHLSFASHNNPFPLIFNTTRKPWFSRNYTYLGLLGV
jgi:hypothetical protein